MKPSIVYNSTYDKKNRKITFNEMDEEDVIMCFYERWR